MKTNHIQIVLLKHYFSQFAVLSQKQTATNHKRTRWN